MASFNTSLHFKPGRNVQWNNLLHFIFYNFTLTASLGLFVGPVGASAIKRCLAMSSSCYTLTAAHSPGVSGMSGSHLLVCSPSSCACRKRNQKSFIRRTQVELTAQFSRKNKQTKRAYSPWHPAKSSSSLWAQKGKSWVMEKSCLALFHHPPVPQQAPNTGKVWSGGQSEGKGRRAVSKLPGQLLRVQKKPQKQRQRVVSYKPCRRVV